MSGQASGQASEPAEKQKLGIETLTSMLLLVSAVAGLVLLQSQIDVFNLGEPGPDARSFPRFVLALLGGALLLRLLAHRGKSDSPVGPARNMAQVTLVAVAMIAAVAMLTPVGFFPSAVLVGIVTTLVLGARRPFLDIGLIVILSAIVTFGARMGLGIPLP
jgi:hypothetical protein